MASIKVSIVIPVYNIEKYLAECLESVINQTLKEIEIICINDGSTDKSLNILEKYEAQDSRIRIIDKQNEGQGVARNIGIKEAKGEYIAFLDSDDWFDLTFCEKLYEKASQFDLDVVLTGIQRFDDKKKKNILSENIGIDIIANVFPDKVFSFEDAKKYYFNVFCVPWNKLYKVSFLRENNLYFPEDIWFEDTTFFFKMLYYVRKMYIVDEKLHYYRKNREGSDTEKGNKKYFDFIKNYENIYNFFIEKGIYEGIKKDFWNYKTTCLREFFLNIKPKYRKEFFYLIKEDFKKYELDREFLNEMLCFSGSFFTNAKKMNYYTFMFFEIFMTDFFRIYVNQKALMINFCWVKTRLSKNKKIMKFLKNLGF